MRKELARKQKSDNATGTSMNIKVNLFIIGAMKSGTTSLHEYLNDHPQISMSTEKEPGYFVDELRKDRDEEWYQGLFQERENIRYFGEASTHYAKYPLYKGVANRIYQYNPEAKLIYIMRNPFNRIVSHYWHAVRTAHSGGEAASISSAIKSHRDYQDFSNYPLQLQQYYQFFQPKNIYVVTFEQLTKDTESVTREIFKWLDLHTDVKLSSIDKTFNAQPERIVGRAGLGILNKIQYSKVWGAISPFIPKGIKNTANNAAYITIDKEKQNQQIHKLKQEMEDTFINQVRELKLLTGRDFQEWPEYNKNEQQP
jgi:hypothetical protein|tara:strand:- start:4889 stop:5824 length:936 start_codon:yes stop_codon:yes gene_type:complete